MSSEQNVSEVPSHQPPPPSDQAVDTSGGAPNPGSGQSKSSRRRRRKRKGGRGPEEMAGGDNGGVISSVQASAGSGSASAPRENTSGSSGFGNAGFTNGSSQTGGGNGQGGFASRDQAGAKRWKKRFRDRDRPHRNNDNPGNQASLAGSNNNSGSSAPAFGGAFNNSGPRDTNTHQFGNRSDGFKRKGSSGGGKRERGPRSFVGPMDHSYRAASVIDGGSTVEGFLGGWSRSSHSGDSQPIDYSQGRPIPIAEDAPTRIYFFIEDLFFFAKINETARKLGVKIAFIKSDKESVAELLALEDDGRPGLIVVDLNNANAKPLTLIPKIKAKFKRQTSIIGFLSHLQGDLKAKAVEAGCDTVMPRAAFSQNLPNLLRRYGVEEEHEDDNFNS